MVVCSIITTGCSQWSKLGKQTRVWEQASVIDFSAEAGVAFSTPYWEVLSPWFFPACKQALTMNASTWLDCVLGQTKDTKNTQLKEGRQRTGTIQLRMNWYPSKSWTKCRKELFCKDGRKTKVSGWKSTVVPYLWTPTRHVYIVEPLLPYSIERINEAWTISKGSLSALLTSLGIKAKQNRRFQLDVCEVTIFLELGTFIGIHKKGVIGTN